MDSLLAVRLRTFIVQLLQKASKSYADSTPRNVIYDHPSISALAKYILSAISSNSPDHASHATGDPESGIKARVQTLVERYTFDLPPRNVDHAPNVEDDGSEFIIVTGTTGSLGSFILDQLLDRPSVKRIYCFNRKTNADTVQRQLGGFRSRGLDIGKLERELGERVVLHDIDLSHPKLGLADNEYNEVSNTLGKAF